jgi:hypothetical protein
LFSITGSLLFMPAFATSASLDKPSYYFGDLITISGKVTIVEGQFIGLQILNPKKSDIVTIDQFLPNSDGTFLKKYKAQGPKWQLDGAYIVKIVYNEETLQKTFQFQNSQSSESTETKNSQGTSSQTTKQNSDIKSTPKNISDPKTRVQGFPDPNESPSYYLERYKTDKIYKEWFDIAFPDYTIEDVVGYKTTRIPNFPDNQYSPWSYVERYNQEEQFRDWYDSQFQSTSLYDVLGYPESLFQKVPSWIKNNAKWWSSGLISDADFLNGIEFMINENIIHIPNLPESGNSAEKTVPTWIKNTAKWWADGQIDENEFLKGISFLVEHGIIVP